MEKNQSLFSSIDTSYRTKVKLGNGMIVEAQGKGSVPIFARQGTKIITEVLFIPELDKNLLSVPQMESKGYSILFKDNNCFIYDPANVEVARVKKFDNSYVLHLKHLNQTTLSIKNDET
ncbi:hypothetical protein MANES_09G173501v8 [Manihot esculenta]|uniref:Uncharacterized protein n=1 Tax=Manihot esculenta TaxID=3983 RepID=A0ACB7H7D4_MANES|nr:hypothetical protein MANES_09G173501v8 [Manihot esculenta]